jgi:hypothetical protein
MAFSVKRAGGTCARSRTPWPQGQFGNDVGFSSLHNGQLTNNDVPFSIPNFQVNLGLMDSPRQQMTALYSNVSLVQAQAIVVSLVASLVSANANCQ